VRPRTRQLEDAAASAGSVSRVERYGLSLRITRNQNAPRVDQIVTPLTALQERDLGRLLVRDGKHLLQAPIAITKLIAATLFSLDALATRGLLAGGRDVFSDGNDHVVVRVVERAAPATTTRRVGWRWGGVVPERVPVNKRVGAGRGRAGIARVMRMVCEVCRSIRAADRRRERVVHARGGRRRGWIRIMLGNTGEHSVLLEGRGCASHEAVGTTLHLVS
jgi:hypothetical protein